MTDQAPAIRRRSRPWVPGLADVAYAPASTGLALLLLWYLHGVWQPWWALACGVGAGLVLRRVVAQAYAAFPPFLCRPLDAGVVLVGTFLGSWATLAGYPLPYWVLRWREALTLPASAALLGLGIAAVVYTFRRLQTEIEDREARLAALREAELRARLRALQAQINPHFLFNALNSLAEMVHGDADEAEQMVGDLAHLLRYSLRSGSGLVTLDQELEAVRRYLRLEGARLGARLRVQEHIGDGAGAAELPGLVLQPLVENAVKHAVAPRPEGGLVRRAAPRPRWSSRTTAAGWGRPSCSGTTTAARSRAPSWARAAPAAAWPAPSSAWPWPDAAGWAWVAASWAVPASSYASRTERSRERWAYARWWWTTNPWPAAG